MRSPYLHYVLDDDHNVIPVDTSRVEDLIAVAMDFENRQRNTVRHTIVYGLFGRTGVSTVFLGIDHGWGEGPPIVFETMIFGGPRDSYQYRCSTWAEAEAQHDIAVTEAREAAWDWRGWFYKRLANLYEDYGSHMEFMRVGLYPEPDTLLAEAWRMQWRHQDNWWRE